MSIVGGIHGGLFRGYILVAALATWYYKWNVSLFAQAFVASLVPIGTFWFDRKLKAIEEANSTGTHETRRFPLLAFESFSDLSQLDG